MVLIFLKKFYGFIIRFHLCFTLLYYWVIVEHYGPLIVETCFLSQILLFCHT